MKNKWMLVGLVLVLSACSGQVLDGSKQQNNQASPDNTQKQAQINLSDPCSNFSDGFVGQAIGKTIVKHELKQSGPSNACQYYVDESAFVSIVANNMDPEVQRKGAEMMKRTVSTDGSIGIDHFIATQEDGQINAIYLILGPMEFVRIDRSSLKAADNQTLIGLAKQVAEDLK